MSKFAIAPQTGLKAIKPTPGSKTGLTFVVRKVGKATGKYGDGPEKKRVKLELAKTRTAKPTRAAFLPYSAATYKAAKALIGKRCRFTRPTAQSSLGVAVVK